MKLQVLIVEDGDEYAEFVRAFLAADCDVLTAGSAAAALQLLDEKNVDLLLLDLRFERAPLNALVGDAASLQRRLFNDDAARTQRHLAEQQGTFILQALRRAGHAQPALFVQDFSPRRLHNLQQLYGEVWALRDFDAEKMRTLFGRATLMRRTASTV
jgi:CheY-like chemotaxis protein